MFLYDDMYGVPSRSFGRAVAFIEHNHSGVTHHLALIRVFNTIEEPTIGALYYVDELGLVIVNIAVIVEPIGRIGRVHEQVQSRRVQSSARPRLETRYWIARSTRLELAMQ